MAHLTNFKIWTNMSDFSRNEYFLEYTTYTWPQKIFLIKSISQILFNGCINQYFFVTNIFKWFLSPWVDCQFTRERQIIFIFTNLMYFIVFNEMFGWVPRNHSRCKAELFKYLVYSAWEVDCSGGVRGKIKRKKKKILRLNNTTNSLISLPESNWGSNSGQCLQLR